LHLSKLLVVGSPEELKALPNITPAGKKRVEIAAHDIAGLLLRLKARPGVEEATIFGQAIRALVSENDQLQDIAAPGIEIRPTEPNLEDVFVTIARTKHAA
jgi:hypothetical protein